MTFLKLITLFFACNVGDLGKTGATGMRNLIIDTSLQIKTESLLSEFLTDLTELSSEILDTHRLLILGKDEETLRATRVLVERGTPYYVYTELAATDLFFRDSGDSAVLFLVDGFDSSQKNSTFGLLPSDYRCRTLLISMKEDTTGRSTVMTILSAVGMKLRNVMFARFEGGTVKIYGRETTPNCTQKIKLFNKWIPGKGFRKKTNVLGHDLVLKEHGCPMFVSTFEMLPTMALRKNDNRSFRIKGGVEGRLINAIAEYLNIVPVVKMPSVKDQMWIAPNGTVLGIVGDVAREEASFGIGQIRPTAERLAIVDFTNPYGYECVAWTVPFETKHTYSVLTSEFSVTTWIIVVLSVASFCAVAYAARKLDTGAGTSLEIFDVIAMSLNYTIPRPPTSLLCKLLFLLYLNYSRIISTAYSTSLSSILTTAIPEPAIVDEEGMIAAGLRTSGTQSSLSTLTGMEVTDNGTKIELINRYEVILSVEEALARMCEHRDIAHIATCSIVNYIRKELLITGEPIEFSTLPDCVVEFHPVIVTPKGSRLTGEVDNVIQRLVETGLRQHWLNLDETSEAPIKSFVYKSHALSRLEPIFLLYLCCLIPALAAFAAELIAFKLKLNWFAR